MCKRFKNIILFKLLKAWRYGENKEEEFMSLVQKLFNIGKKIFIFLMQNIDVIYFSISLAFLLPIFSEIFVIQVIHLNLLFYFNNFMQFQNFKKATSIYQLIIKYKIKFKNKFRTSNSLKISINSFLYLRVPSFEQFNHEL